MFDLIINLDKKLVLDIVQSSSDGVITLVMKALTFMGNDGLVWIMLSLILFILKKKRIGFEVLMALSFSYTLTEILKYMVERPRPFHVLSNIRLLIEPPSGTSFPSGHTATSFAVAMIICIHMPKKYGVLALITACFMGFSRVYFGVHYPSDVLMGSVLGIASGLFIDYITNRGLIYKNRISIRKG